MAAIERDEREAAGGATVPFAVDLGPSALPCSGCGGIAGNRMLSLPGEPAATAPAARFAYSLCGSCESLDLVDVPAEMAGYYGGAYYSFRSGGAARGLKAGIARLRNRAEAFGSGGLGGLLARIAPHARLRQLRPLVAGAVGRPLGRDARILDLGCGDGGWLRQLAELGFRDLTGADPYLEPSEAPGLRLIRAGIDEVEGRFDLVACSHALEHMADPEAALAAMARLAGPDGVVMVAIPLAASYGWRRYGGEWVQLDAPRHLHLYSARGFASLAGRAGLELLRTTFDATEFMVLGSEARLAGIGPHQRREGLGDVKAAMRAFDRAGARRIAALTNRLGTADQATFYLRSKSAPGRPRQG
ncbi:class I SAM-dependent methyltransferase [Paralimibaculum aggregatum]|nr:class I SAM-dependent methyltransferase [Limibaculum sp. NKW23]